MAANLFLNTRLGTWAINRRPERFKASWSSAWSVWPGGVWVRGLALGGHSANGVTWTVTVDRGRGLIDVPALLGRRFVVNGFHGEGVRSSVWRGEEEPDTPGKPDEKPRPPWGIRIDHVELEGVREVGYNGFRLTGDGQGRVSGGFSFVFGKAFRMADTRLAMPAARLWLSDELLSQDLDVDGTVSFAPFVPHEHPGMEGWDFLSGSLKAHGKVPGLPFLARSGLQGTHDPGRLVADLRVDRGRLTPGSHAELVTGTAPGSAPALELTAKVPAGAAELRLGLQAQGLQAGRKPGRQPVFQCAAVAATVHSPETQLRRLFVTARELRTKTNLTALPPLAADMRLEGVRLEAPGDHAHVRLQVDHATGRIDLAALARQDVDIEGLQAQGVAAQLAFPAATASKPKVKAVWSAHISGARLAGVREIGIDPFLLTGASQLEATFSYEPAGRLEVQRAALSLPAGTLLRKGQPVAQNLTVKAEARTGPLAVGSPDLAFLRQVSGRTEVRARISSLGFLDPYLRKVPWLALQGEGNLDAAVGLDAGRLTPGSRLAVRGARLRATLLDSLASGSGQLTVAVDPQGRTAMQANLDRFGLADLRQAGRPDYIRGHNLRLTASSTAPLDLAVPMPDFDASLTLADAVVPDLKVFDALLPAGAGFYLLSGTGRVGLRLALSTATRTTRGMASLSSDSARVGFQDLEIQGRVSLQAPFSSPDLQARHFDLDGARLTLDEVSYRQTGDAAPSAAPGWWARARLADAAVEWGQPLSLRAAGQAEMRDSGPLIALFAQRSKVVKWFDSVLSVEGVTAQGVLRIDQGVVAIDSFQATGGKLEVRSRMSFSKQSKSGDLLVRYGRLSAGIEMLDGKRSFKLIRPQDWFEQRMGLRQ